MDHGPTSTSRLLRRRNPWWRRWSRLRHHVRLRPHWPWWAAWIGGATAVAAVLDAASIAPWWLGPPVGALLGVGVLALTVLDDVRRPLTSLRVLAAELRGGPSPGWANAVRATAFGIPLYAPPPGDAPDVRITGGGASYGPHLLSPARRRISLSWGTPDRSRSKHAWATTVVAPDDGRDTRWLYDALFRTRPADEPLDDEAWSAIDHDRLERAQEHVSTVVVLDGTAHDARAADLAPWGSGWAATLRLDGRHRLDLAGRGPLPDRLELVRRDPTDLAGP